MVPNIIIRNTGNTMPNSTAVAPRRQKDNAVVFFLKPGQSDLIACNMPATPYSVLIRTDSDRLKVVPSNSSA